MALDRSFVRIRFIFGEGKVKARQRFDNFAAFTTNRIAVAFADEAWDQIRDRLKQQIAMDVNRELANMANLFRRHITQLGGNRSGTIGNLTGERQTLSLASALPPWAPRNAKYLARKADAGAGAKWFNNTGWTRGLDRRFSSRQQRTGRWPRDPGRLAQEIQPQFLTAAFGPIKVSVTRDKSTAAARATINTTGGRHAQVQLAKIRVSALGRITPDVLSSLRTGDLNGVVAPRLAEIIGDSSAPYHNEIAYRLGRMKNGVYRPTLEPFLGFFLTRALPAAVGARIGKGSLKRLVRTASRR